MMESEGRHEGCKCHSPATTEEMRTGDASSSGVVRKTGDSKHSSGSCPPSPDSRAPYQGLSAESDLSIAGVELPNLADLTGRQSDSHMDPMGLNAATASASKRPNDAGGKTCLVQRYPVASSSPFVFAYYSYSFNASSILHTPVVPCSSSSSVPRFSLLLKYR